MRKHFVKSRMFILIVFLVCAVSGTKPSSISAAPDMQESSPLSGQTWVRLGGPLGGIGYDIKMDPQNPDIMFATDAFSGIHKSMDRGASWFSINNGIDVRAGESGDSVPVFCVTIDPNNSSTVWIGLQNTGAIYKSTNGGETWVKKIQGVVEKGGFTVRGISVEPGNSDVVYAAGEISSSLWASEYKNFQGFDIVKGVVYKSMDGGENWTPIWRGDNLARYVVVDPATPDTIYISTGIFDRIAANADPQNGEPGGTGIFKSEDGGMTWSPINNGLRNLYVGSLYMHPKDPNILLAGTGHAFFDTDGGIYRTTNGGLDWSYVGGGSRVVSIEISTSDPEIAYAADVAHSKFFRSEDGGITWETLTRNGVEGWGPEDIFAGWPIDLQVDLYDPDRVFVNNYGGGNFLSEDGGNHWSIASTGYTGARIYDLALDLKNPSTVYAAGASGIFRSEDGGFSWESLGDQFAGGQLIVIDPENSNSLFVSRSSLMLVQKTINKGDTWKLVMNYEAQLQNLQQLGTSADQQGLSEISFSPSNPDVLYAGVIQAHCFLFGDGCTNVQTIFSIAKSMDRGTTWEPVYDAPFNGHSITDIVIHPDDQNTIWVATADLGVYKSMDGGLAWKKVTPAGGMDIARSLKANPGFPDHLLLGTDQGVYSTLDGGETWQKSSAGMEPNNRVWDLVFDPVRNNIVYAGTLASGVYLSEDAGATWQLINGNLANRTIYTLVISADGETLYAGSGGEGVFRLSTHDQTYFDSLAPTPTSTPVAITPTPIATATPEATSTPILPTAMPAPVESSTNSFLLTGAVILLMSLFVLVWFRRRSKGY